MKRYIIAILMMLILIKGYVFADEIEIVEEEKEVEEKLTFSDVKEGHWAYEAIMKCLEKGIVEGMADGTFGSGNPISREAFATIITRAYNIDMVDPKVATYTDLDNDKWAYKYVESTKQYFDADKKNGKLYFSPKKSMTREEIAITLVLVLGLEKETVKAESLDKFRDANLITQDIKGLVAIAVQNELIKGSNNELNPQKLVSRAEAITMLNNALNISEERGDCDKELGKTLSIYNDGYVSFKYPIDYKNKLGKLDGTLKEDNIMKSFHMEDNGIRISVYYTSIPTSMSYEGERGIGTNGLNEIAKYLRKSEYSEFEANNYNNRYVLLKYTSEFGNRTHIYGQGIGKMIPQIVVQGVERYGADQKMQTKTEGERYAEDVIVDLIVEKIRDSFVQVTDKKIFKSAGVDKNVMETYPINNQKNIEEDVIVSISCNALIGWGSKYSLKDVDGNEIKDIEIYYSTNQNKLKIKFGSKLINGKTYVLEPLILNDIDGNFISGGEICFAVGEGQTTEADGEKMK